MQSLSTYLFQISGCAALTAILAAPAQAGLLRGAVTHGTSGVPSAIVSFYQIGAGSTKFITRNITRTNNLGRYAFNNLPSGSYIVLVEKDGRRIYQGRFDVPVQSTHFDIQL